MRSPFDATAGGLDSEAEFERLVLPSTSRMMRTIWRVVRDPELAEDAFQEALTTLWRKLPVVRQHPNPQAFILRVCLDAACDQVRARARRRSGLETIDEADPGFPYVRSESVEGPTMVGEVMRAVGRLRPRQATALLLRVLNEASYEAIARAIGCSEATARVHVQRARERMRKALRLDGNTNKVSR